jgi:3-oxoacyl-[acyl-carrier protein] reductase
MDANLTSTFLTVKSVLPGMKERGARSHHHHGVGREPTTASGFTGGVCRRQGRDRDIHARPRRTGRSVWHRANCIAPETILTERNEEQIPARGQGIIARASTRFAASAPPTIVARAALFLASDDASWITEWCSTSLAARS